jgi:hypothetical protein
MAYPLHTIMPSRSPSHSAFATALALLFATVGGKAADAPAPSVREVVLPLHLLQAVVQK